MARVYHFWILVLCGFLIPCVYGQDKLDILQLTLEAAIHKMDETMTEIQGIKASLVSQQEKQDETRSDVQEVKATLASLQEKQEETKGTVESLKEDISGLAELEKGCQSLMDSFNSTMSDLIESDIIRSGSKLLNECIKHQPQSRNAANVLESHSSTPSDCKDIHSAGHRRNGIYKISPSGSLRLDGINVYCDLLTDGGGWIVILRRQKQTQQEEFIRSFEKYSEGFGEVGGEFWIGNRNLHAITGDRTYTLRVEATDHEGNSKYGNWETFSVGSEKTQFTLTVEGYDDSTSTIGDALTNPSPILRRANTMKFSTFDIDNDSSEEHCSVKYGKSGWWFNKCMGTNPTGSYTADTNCNKVSWGHWPKNEVTKCHPLSSIQFKIRPQ